MGPDGAVAKTTYLPEMAILRELLREIRESADLRQVDLAEALERPQSFVSEYESGQRRLDLVELREVCEECGTSLANLVDEYERRLANQGRD
jgi:transcriptional regulator with XRE-family HTH domain